MAEWLSLDEAAGLIPDGSSLALGGAHAMGPMALTRALIRRGVKGLKLYTAPVGGLALDLLIASGAVESVDTPQVSLGEMGQAPAWRAEVEAGRLKVRDWA